MSYRANLTDKAQSELEAATFEGGVPVFEDAKTRVIAKGADGSPERKIAGVVLPASDLPSKFPSDTIGRKV